MNLCRIEEGGGEVKIKVLAVVLLCFMNALKGGQEMGVYCKYCGQEARDVRALVSGVCPKHPAGFAKGKHALFEGEARGEYVCVYCGQTASSVRALVTVPCPKHPDGFAKGKHVAYEGSPKTKYTCKYCGQQMGSIRALVNGMCPKHPNGFAKGRHSPAR